MYPPHQISKTKQAFWTAFGLYMKPVPSAEGERMNWKNYKTGVKHLFFRMEAERSFASISIEITHPDPTSRILYFEQFQDFKKLLSQDLKEEWVWTSAFERDHGVTCCKIEKRLEGVNVMEESSWADIISFLKPRIMALDTFWARVKYGFEEIT